ncbi:hypothetical protein EPICR_10197 [Candidatus Desulfarcum epimagneticum]|uniref:Filamentation induced by cAMP protein Fic-like C-terminal domain-containing protein n=1 Tax=uncultured Desulfobacteraceae bacterium TaxID=218296 RepID=A0A484HGB2_9BACT|nr:hypothetical protein EPICR_10197 [uncultured Desulfobacteraceae bacterium]
MVERILRMPLQKPLSKSDIAKNMGKEKPSRYLNDVMKRMVEAKRVEYTIPKKPTSRFQRYRITADGRRSLRRMK